MVSAEVDEDIDEGVEIGNGLLITELWSLNTEGFSLRVDTLGAGALFAKVLVRGSVPVELIAETRSDGSRHSGQTAPLGPRLVANGTGLTGGVRMKEGATVATPLMFDQGGFADVG
jgi:hypothetical protein